MKLRIGICLLASALIGAVAGQDKAPLRKGVSVNMAVANHAVEMRAADEADSTVIAITADGKIYLGITPTDPAALGTVNASTVYVKADSRVPYQTLLNVLDALHGKSVVLLTATPANVPKAGIVPPYGVKMTLSR